MAKLSHPLFSLDAWGRFTRAFSLRRSRHGSVLESTPLPIDARTSRQLSWRTMFQLAVDLWHSLSPSETLSWESAARSHNMTGYAWFISQALRPNPGIYLPLAGGTMQGAIDMDGNIIDNLPAPTSDEEPVRKVDLSGHAAIPLVHVGTIPAFHVNRNNNDLSITSGAWTKVPWLNEVFDTNNDFSNSKFTPTIPGYYLFIVSLRIDSLGADKCMLNRLYNNGNFIAYVGKSYVPVAADAFATGSFIAYANGITDYFEVYVWHNHGSSRQLSGNFISTYFQGFRLVG